jgi:RimJ/RimL family protein N-acetyltransferase
VVPALGRTVLRTERLLLRRWREEDRDGFAALNADPVVMEHFPAPLTRARSDLVFDLFDVDLEANGFGIWAVDEVRSGELVGFAGLARVSFLAHFTPAVEVGWRLVPRAWGRGYATEAATAALGFAFETIGLDEVVSFTATTNRRSIAVMERLGMTHDGAEDFNHPQIASSHPLCRHVLYRASAERWPGARTRSAAPLSPESGPRR